ncbi:hypothetical protein [Sphingosinicella terrae]|jgi:hypothetical protein|uniref:hypothetical protein n=1 Tax=Sphingosinicella terrae TaxID=2172047 RepID=UPI000E0CC0E9|nr:hypothetical protein [Sphingosinicella terrae]
MTKDDKFGTTPDSRINKAGTSEGKQDFEIAGNVREKGQKSSPGDRDRGERADTDRATAEDRG